ncbi:15051_t:CDS:1 [Dentiscutata erythropus]|uniref:15051_t:CDS:1 n=1 Tax=Dentiscutata erythropus TaxID=1348616 RepID=A0A9N9EZ83_9GLOM|nr:15051_t:CDS:1 [Dentiscutata erythropus]
MGVYGVGNYYRIEGNINKELYHEILKDELIGMMQAWHLTNNDFVFQHDNDLKHMSDIVTDWLDEKGIDVLTWPLYSPNLNPIEHLWDEVNRHLQKLPGNISSKMDLWNKIQKVWNEIDDDYVLKLIDTMSQRIKDVLKAKGGYTKW